MLLTTTWYQSLSSRSSQAFLLDRIIEQCGDFDRLALVGNIRADELWSIMAVETDGLCVKTCDALRTYTIRCIHAEPTAITAALIAIAVGRQTQKEKTECKLAISHSLSVLVDAVQSSSELTREAQTVVLNAVERLTFGPIRVASGFADVIEVLISKCSVLFKDISSG